MIYYQNVAARDGPLQQLGTVPRGRIHMPIISKGDQSEDRLNKHGQHQYDMYFSLLPSFIKLDSVLKHKEAAPKACLCIHNY
jgi:hypothetical protein